MPRSTTHLTCTSGLKESCPSSRLASPRPKEEGLYAIVCVALTSKFFESKPLSVIEMHTLTNQAYTRSQFNQTETALLSAFDYALFDHKRQTVSELQALYLESCKPILPSERYDLICTAARMLLDLVVCEERLSGKLQPPLAAVASNFD